MTNPLPEFRLRPYDRLKPRASTPRAVAVARVAGRDWMMRCEQRIVFFREIESTHSDWTFCIMPRIAHRDAYDESSIVAWFELHFGEGKWEGPNVGRFHQHFFDGCFSREFPLFFGADGSGVCREYYNEDDLPFSWQAHEKWSWKCLDKLGKSELEQVAKKIVYRQIVEPLNRLSMEGVDFSEGEVEWLCGSRDEFVQLCQWICHAEPQMFKSEDKVEISFESENSYSRAHLTFFAMGQYREPPLTYRGWMFLLNASDELIPDPESFSKDDWPFSKRTAKLFQLALDYNTPIGGHWQYHDCCSGRAANSPHSNLFEVEVQKPSTQETCEARQALRAWLEGKVPLSEIAELLRD